MAAIAESDLPAHMRALVALWREKAGARAWPNRRDILFEELVPWLGRLHLVDVMEGDFRFAVHGNATMGVPRRDYTGMLLSQIEAPRARIWEAGYRDAVARRGPLFAHHSGPEAGDDGGGLGWWRVVLPLGTDEAVENLLVLIQVHRPDGTFL
ncbi:MAG: hypothetical protein GC202_08275 [Alphaproteobacteria bacterium]|nr:hypothetical protein [Alphaproteobacteria bacterium]